MVLVILLLQGLTAPRSFEDAIEAYTRGDETARTELLEAGACSIPALRRVRDRAPGRIEALIYDIKKAVAHPESRRLIGRLDQIWSIEGGELSFPAAIEALGTGLPLAIDPKLLLSHVHRKATFHLKEGPRRDWLDAFCTQMGLDYGFFYGVVLIARPERLWAQTPPVRRVPLGPEALGRAARWIASLGSDQAEEREVAQTGLLGLGPGVIPLLEQGAKGTDDERRARCREILQELGKPPPPAPFHVPGASRQKLSEEDLALRRSLEGEKQTCKVCDLQLHGAIRFLLAQRHMSAVLSPSLLEVRVTFEFEKESLWTILGVTTHAYGFDFMIEHGTLVIDRAAEIERRLRSLR